MKSVKLAKFTAQFVPMGMPIFCAYALWLCVTTVFLMSLSIQSMRMVWDRRNSFRLIFCLEVTHSVLLECVLMRRRSFFMVVLPNLAMSLKMRVIRWLSRFRISSCSSFVYRVEKSCVVVLMDGLSFVGVWRLIWEAKVSRPAELSIIKQDFWCRSCGVS